MRTPPFLIVSHMELEHPTSKLHRERFYTAFKQGGSNHSGLAQTLPAIIRQAEQERQPYRLTAYPGYGYFIEPLPPISTVPRFEVRHDDHIFDRQTETYVGIASFDHDKPGMPNAGAGDVVRALNSLRPPHQDAIVAWFNENRQQ